MIVSLFSALTVGLLVGVISSVLGLGGGVVIVPLLTLVFNLPHNQAIATSLMTIAFTTTLNTIRFQKYQMINWRIVFIIVSFSALSSFAGGYLATVLNDRLLLFIFLLFVIYVFIQTLFLKPYRQQTTRNGRSVWAWGSIIGILSGLISGTTGVGGGAIITPLLFKSRVERHIRVVPITNAVMLINAIFALIPLAFSSGDQSGGLTVGMIHVDLALLIFIGVIPASLYGTHIQSRISLKVKKGLIGLILLIILIRMAWRFFAGA